MKTFVLLCLLGCFIVLPDNTFGKTHWIIKRTHTVSLQKVSEEKVSSDDVEFDLRFDKKSDSPIVNNSTKIIIEKEVDVELDSAEDTLTNKPKEDLFFFPDQVKNIFQDEIKKDYKDESGFNICNCVPRASCKPNGNLERHTFHKCEPGFVCCIKEFISESVVGPAKNVFYLDIPFAESIHPECGHIPKPKTRKLNSEEKDTILLEAPWTVFVKGYNFLGFGGALIHPRAALIVKRGNMNLDTSKFVIQAGGSALINLYISESNLAERIPSQLIVHPKPINKGSTDSLAIVIWDEPMIEDPGVMTVCINPATFTDEKCDASDWQIINKNTQVMTNVNITIKDQNSCDQDGSTLCVETDGKNCYSGGGPLVCQKLGRSILAGLVSWNQNCQGNHEFVNIASYSHWIKETLYKNNLI